RLYCQRRPAVDDLDHVVARPGPRGQPYLDVQDQPMKAYVAGRRGQAGFTLVELIVASAIGVILMTGLTSVVYTSYRSWSTASSRVEASGQIRNFQYFAYDDFSRSLLPANQSCTRANP